MFLILRVDYPDNQWQVGKVGYLYDEHNNSDYVKIVAVFEED